MLKPSKSSTPSSGFSNPKTEVETTKYTKFHGWLGNFFHIKNQQSSFINRQSSSSTLFHRAIKLGILSHE